MKKNSSFVNLFRKNRRKSLHIREGTGEFVVWICCFSVRYIRV